MAELKTTSKEQVLKLFRDTFVCRTDVYAKGAPRGDGKYFYFTARDHAEKDLPLSNDVIWSHLRGEIIIGIYPIVESDKTGWLALDFDDGDDPIGDAFRQRDALKLSGLYSYVERSRSGKGAHLWLFFDGLIRAFKTRRVMYNLLLPEFKERYTNRKNANTAFDMMFPNQDTAGTSYGNLIALPYHGESYKKHKNSCFVDNDRNPVHPVEFLENVKKNKAEVVDLLFSKLPQESHSPRLASSGVRNLPVMKLPGGLKVCEFCNWVKQAKERMPNQNQEPELYSLACQFAQLDGGNRLLHEMGALHPYSEDRIEEKWNRAVDQNKPETCNTIRSKYGDCGKRCDSTLDITHPYELATVSFSQLRVSERPRPENYRDVAIRVAEKADRVAKHLEPVGIAFGWDELDDLTEMRNGELIIIASLPNIGKSATIVDISTNVGNRGIPSYVASLEMTKDSLVQRMLARRSGIDATRIAKGLLNPVEWKTLNSYARDEFPFYVDDGSATLEQILDMLGDLVHKHGKGPAFVDYLQIIEKEPREDDRQATARAVTGLKTIAKFLDIPVIGLSQLGRQAEKDMRDGEDPMDSWLAHSAMVERVPDIILYLMGKKGIGTVPRRIRIQKERNRGVAGTEIAMELEQSIFRFTCKGKVRSYSQSIDTSDITLL
jgi:hypothetical protein